MFAPCTAGCYGYFQGGSRIPSIARIFASRDEAVTGPETRNARELFMPMKPGKTGKHQ